MGNIPLRPTTGLDDVQQKRRDRETINDILTFRADDWRKRTAAEISAGITPTNFAYEPGDVRRYGAVGDGSTSDQTPIASALSQLAQTGGYPVKLMRGATHVITAKHSLSDISGFKIIGNGATIRAQNGMSVASSTQLLHLTNCTDFVIEDVRFDGNRANRTPAEVSSHLLQMTDCQRFTLRNVRADNATTDGIRLDASDANTHSTYCRDFVIENCHADFAYRNGMGIINAFDGVVIGGSFTGTDGVAPEAGVDVESNTALDPGDRSIRFIGTRFTGNDGYGLQFAGSEGEYAMEAVGCYFSDNDLGGVLASAPTKVIGGEFDNFTASGSFGVKVNAAAISRVQVIGASFRNFGSSAGSCIDDGSSSTLTMVIGCHFQSVVNAATVDGARLIFTDNWVDATSGIGVSFGSGCRATIRGNRILAATGRAIFGSGTDSEIIGNRCTDVASVSGAYIQAEGARNVITHNTCEAASSSATTFGIRAHWDATAVAFNRFVNLHSSNPITMQGTESGSSAVVFANSGGSINIPRAFFSHVQAPFTVGPYTQDNVAASQTNVALAGTRWVAPRDGVITGVVVKSTEARTAGTCTVEVYVNTGLSGANGTGSGLTAVLDGTNTSARAVTQAYGPDTFAAGNEVYAVVTTDGSWAPTTADIRVWIEVQC